MSSAFSEVAIKLAVEYLLPYVVQEATSFAARSAFKETIPAIPSLPTEVPVTEPRITPTTLPFVLSNTPGRLRLRVTGLRGNPARGAAIVGSVARVPGVRTVIANDLTGSILVHYDAQRVKWSDIIEVICREDPVANPNPLLHPRMAGPTIRDLIRN